MEFESVLDGLARLQRWTVAAACAELLRPVMRGWERSQQNSNEVMRRVNNALDAAWVIERLAERKSIVTSVIGLVPDEDAEGWTPDSAAAQNALAAIAYAHRAADGDGRAASRAVVQIQEYADYLDQPREDYVNPSLSPMSVTSRAYETLKSIRNAIQAGASVADVRHRSRVAAVGLWAQGA